MRVVFVVIMFCFLYEKMFWFCVHNFTCLCCLFLLTMCFVFMVSDVPVQMDEGPQMNLQIHLVACFLIMLAFYNTRIFRSTYCLLPLMLVFYNADLLVYPTASSLCYVFSFQFYIHLLNCVL